MSFLRFMAHQVIDVRQRLELMKVRSAKERVLLYLDLNAAADKEGRLFITDSQANGLRAEPEKNAPFDISWRDMSSQILYNRDWKSQKMKEDAYRKRFTEDEAQYTAMLEILKNALSAASTAAPAQ